VAVIDIRCPTCNAKIAASAANVVEMVAKCEACDVVFDFAAPASLGRAVQPAVSAAPVPLPPGITVERQESSIFGDYRHAPREAGQLVITRRWFRWSLLPLLGFCVIWDGFLIVWYGNVLTGNAPLIAGLFPLLHVAVGVGLTYSCLAGLFNRTVIRVAGGRLTVRHGPIPWIGNRDVPTDELRQLYTEQVVSSGKSQTVRYNVHAIVAVGPTLSIVSKLEEQAQALYIEKEIERHLGIEDQRVPGAVDA